MSYYDFCLEVTGLVSQSRSGLGFGTPALVLKQPVGEKSVS